MEFQFGFRLKDFTNHNRYLSESSEQKKLFKYHYQIATIDVDLDAFNERQKFITPDLHQYCVRLLNKLRFDNEQLVYELLSGRIQDGWGGDSTRLTTYVYYLCSYLLIFKRYTIIQYL